MHAMGPLEHQSSLSVTYRSPPGHRVFAAFKVSLVGLFLMLFVAAFFWGALVPGAFPQGAPVLAHAIGVALLLPVPVLMLWLGDHSHPTRIVLHEDHLRLGSWPFARIVLFDDVRLVKLERHERTVGKVQKLVVQQRGGKSMGIWLKGSDAAECFEALRMICEHIPALGPADEIYGPVNSKHMHHARWVVAREFRRKARRALASCILCTVFSLSAASGLIYGSVNSRNQARAWMAVVILPAGAIGSAVAFSRYRRRARDLDRENEEMLAAEAAAAVPKAKRA